MVWWFGCTQVDYKVQYLKARFLFLAQIYYCLLLNTCNWTNLINQEIVIPLSRQGTSFNVNFPRIPVPWRIGRKSDDSWEWIVLSSCLEEKSVNVFHCGFLLETKSYTPYKMYNSLSVVTITHNKFYFLWNLWVHLINRCIG